VASGRRTRLVAPLLALALLVLAAACGVTPPIGASPGGAAPPTGTGADGATTTATVSPLTVAVTHAAGSRAITIVLTLDNETGQPIQYTAGCVQPYVVTMAAGGGAVVHRWPEPSGGASCGAIALITLAPGESRTSAVAQSESLSTPAGAPLAPGIYTIAVRFSLVRDASGKPATLDASVQVRW
jgi:hypothetical protein